MCELNLTVHCKTSMPLIIYTPWLGLVIIRVQVESERPQWWCWWGKPSKPQWFIGRVR